MAWSDAADMIKFMSHIFCLKIDFDTVINNFSFFLNSEHK